MRLRDSTDYLYRLELYEVIGHSSFHMHCGDMSLLGMWPFFLMIRVLTKL